MSLLVKFQADFAGWPMTQQHWDKTKFSWLKLTADSMRRLSVASLMYISVGLDRLDSNRSVILVSNPRTGSKKREKTASDYYRELRNYSAIGIGTYIILMCIL